MMAEIDPDFDPEAAVADLVARLPKPPELAKPTGRADLIEARLLDRAGLANLPKPVWQVDDWFLSGSLVVTYGRPGDGKTFFAIDVACSIATGSWWHHNRTQAGRALYIAAEGASMFDARIGAWEAHNGVQVNDLLVHPAAVDLLDLEWAEPLADVVIRTGATHVTIDTLNRCFIGGDENAARDMGMFVQGCDTIRRTGATVHVVHHDSRAGGNPRGSSALDGAADTVIQLSADNGIITARQTKQKDAEPAPPLLMRLTAIEQSAVVADYIDTGTIDGPRLETLRALCDIADANGASSSAWQRASGCQERTFHRHRNWLLQHDYCHNISDRKTPRYAPTEAGRRSGLTPTDSDLT